MVQPMPKKLVKYGETKKNTIETTNHQPLNQIIGCFHLGTSKNWCKHPDNDRFWEHFMAHHYGLLQVVALLKPALAPSELTYRLRDSFRADPPVPSGNFLATPATRTGPWLIV